MRLYVGVDGGGTKTEAMVFDELSQESVLLSAGASNPNTVGADHAVSVIGSLIDEGIRKLNGVPDDLIGLSLCMSGVDRSSQIQSLRSMFEQRYPCAKVEVANDALAALSAGTDGESGVVLIAGTGSIAVGESRAGKIARAGGYGSLLDDEGSGFEMGRQGLMSAVQFAEGRGAFTELWSLACELFQLNKPGELITRVYEESAHPIGTIASFAKTVLEASVTDEVASAIVQKNAQALAGMLASVRTQLNEDLSNQVVLAGGLFTHSDVLRDCLAAELQTESPELTLSPLHERPATGAVMRARRLALSTGPLVRKESGGPSR